MDLPSQLSHTPSQLIQVAVRQGDKLKFMKALINFIPPVTTIMPGHFCFETLISTHFKANFIHEEAMLLLKDWKNPVVDTLIAQALPCSLQAHIGKEATEAPYQMLASSLITMSYQIRLHVQNLIQHLEEFSKRLRQPEPAHLPCSQVLLGIEQHWTPILEIMDNIMVLLMQMKNHVECALKMNSTNEKNN